jgi:glycerophosphoryl diester phosphodiesterase
MDALRAYASAWRRRGFVVPAYLGARLLSIALIAPITAALATAAVSLSGQSALTDLDIAHFLLTPVGFLAAIVMAAILLIGSLVSFTAMAVDLRAGKSRGLIGGLYAALRVMAGRPLALLTYAALLVLRVLAITLPFGLAGLLAAYLLLSAHDINYYLSARPPEFYWAAGIISVLVLAAAFILVRYLLSWALSLHLVLFAGRAPGVAFGESQALMTGRRTRLLGTLLAGLAIHLTLILVLGALFGLLLQAVPALFEQLRTTLAAVLAIAAAWGLGAMVVSAVSLGALAAVLDAVYREANALKAEPAMSEARGFSLPLVLTACLVLGVFGLVASAIALESIQTSDDVEIIAHRGAAGARPENTLASVRKAIEDKADWIEIDVQETADGEIVVIHDSDFMKLSGRDLKIWDATLPQLAEIDIGSWFDPTYAAERTPTLAEVLEIARGRAKVLIELKYYGHDVDLEARTARVIERARMADQIAIMSLKYPAVLKMQDLRPEWRTGVLAATAIGRITDLKGDFVAVNAGQVGPRLVSAAKAAGKKLYVWTVNDPLEMSAMFSMGVDGIITDEPALAREVLAERASMGSAQRLFLLLAERLGLSLPTGEYRDASP